MALVLADRPCRGLGDRRGRGGRRRARRPRTPSAATEAGFDRWGFTRRVTEVLEKHDVDLVAMAGFGTVLARPLFDALPGRILNTHPALLPPSPGGTPWRTRWRPGWRSRAAPCTSPPSTPTPGRCWPRRRSPSSPATPSTTLHERIKQVERRLYPATVKKMIDDLEGAAPVGSCPRGAHEGAAVGLRQDRPHRSGRGARRPRVGADRQREDRCGPRRRRYRRHRGGAGSPVPPRCSGAG